MSDTPASEVEVDSTGQPPFTGLRIRNAGNDPSARYSPLQPLPSVDLDKINDEQALELLLRSETVAGLFQNACATRVNEHQQKLEHAYNQRLLELEQYTRIWRDATKELWSAVKDGTLNPSNDQQKTLLWGGPQAMGSGFKPVPLTTSQEIVKKSDADGKVLNMNVKPSHISRSESHVRCQKWINDYNGSIKGFQPLSTSSINTCMPHNQRLLFRSMNADGKIEYRPSTAVDQITDKFDNDDIVIELSHPNIMILGKAFCYLKDVNDRLPPRGQLNFKACIPADRLYNHFSRAPTKKHIDVLSLPIRKSKRKKRKKSNPGFFAVNTRILVVPKRLLIARLCFTKSDTCTTYGPSFLDVGSGTHITHQGNGQFALLGLCILCVFRRTLLYTRVIG